MIRVFWWNYFNLFCSLLSLIIWTFLLLTKVSISNHKSNLFKIVHLFITKYWGSIHHTHNIRFRKPRVISFQEGCIFFFLNNSPSILGTILRIIFVSGLEVDTCADKINGVSVFFANFSIIVRYLFMVVF